MSFQTLVNILYREFPVRDLRFKFPKDLKRYWYQGCPARTYIFNAISIIVPAFEGLAISSIKPFEYNLKNSQLKKIVGDFISQESSHGSAFIQLNHVLKKQGYPVKKLQKLSLNFFKKFSSKLSSKTHLALTVATEHLTAVFSEITLNDRLFNNSEPVCKKLFLWHAVEEIEHKSVAIDVYNNISGGYLRRCGAMIFVSMIFFGLVAFNFFELIRHDKKLFNIKLYIKTISFLFFKERFFLKMCFGVFRFFKPKFHPWDKDDSSLIQAAIHKLSS